MSASLSPHQRILFLQLMAITKEAQSWSIWREYETGTLILPGHLYHTPPSKADIFVEGEKDRV